MVLIKVVLLLSFSLYAGTIDLTSIKAEREMLKENYAGGQVRITDIAPNFGPKLSNFIKQSFPNFTAGQNHTLQLCKAKLS